MAHMTSMFSAMLACHLARARVQVVELPGGRALMASASAASAACAGVSALAALATGRGEAHHPAALRPLLGPAAGAAGRLVGAHDGEAIVAGAAAREQCATGVVDVERRLEAWLGDAARWLPAGLMQLVRELGDQLELLEVS